MRGLILLVVVCASLAGCSTPASVKALSSEQVKTLEQYQESQKKYFRVIERLVESQIQAAEMLIKESNRDLERKFRQKAIAALDGNEKQRAKEALDELIQNLRTTYEVDQRNRETLIGRLNALKQKHAEMRASYEIILTAQKKLDEYIQLAKADEVFVNRLLSQIGLEQAKVTAAVDDVTAIIGQIEKATKKEDNQ